MSNTNEITVQRSEFYNKLNELLSAKRSDNSFFLNKQRYGELISEVLLAKNGGKRSTVDYRRIKRFDVYQVNNENKLIVPMKLGESNIIYYVRNDEIYDILQEVHLRTGHGGRTKMLKEIQLKYKNITYETVMIYLGICQSCGMKKCVPKKAIVLRKNLTTELNNRGQVDLIDMQSYSDKEFNFLMIYHDIITKFVHLKALIVDTAEEVANVLLDIFLVCGAPCILQSNQGRDFSSKVITELSSMWSDVKIVHGEPRESENQESVELENQDIQNMLSARMQINNTDKWVLGLRFIQFTKNNTYHKTIRQTPHQAMFGVKVKKGLITSSLTSDELKNLESDEDLQKLYESTVDIERPDTTQTISDTQNGDEEQFANKTHTNDDKEIEGITLSKDSIKIEDSKSNIADNMNNFCVSNLCTVELTNVNIHTVDKKNDKGLNAHKITGDSSIDVSEQTSVAEVPKCLVCEKIYQGSQLCSECTFPVHSECCVTRSGSKICCLCLNETTSKRKSEQEQANKRLKV